MPGFFEALENFQPMERKKPTVTIEGKTVEVDIETKKKIMRAGEQAYTWKDGEIHLKPTPRKACVTYRKLKRDKYGYEFHDGDPHWPTKIVEGGFSWQTESE